MKSIQQFLQEIDIRKSYRRRAEMYVVDGDSIWVGVKDNDKVLKNSYTIPGGGVDDGETPINGAIRETLEEVAIRVKNIKDITLRPPFRLDFDDPGDSRWKGTEIYSFTAEFDKVDKRLWGKGGPDGKFKPKKVKIKMLIDHFSKKRYPEFYPGKWREVRNKYVVKILKTLI